MNSKSETPTRGNPSQMISSNEKLECLRDMMGILHSLSDESSAGLSAVTRDNLEYIFFEVKMAMREAVCRVASRKTSSSESSMGNPLFSPLANEVLKALSARSKFSPSAEISERKVFDLRKTQMPDTEAIIGKIVMVVLDLMEGNSAESLDLKETSDLLIAAAERIKLMISAVNSEEDLANKTSFHKKAHLFREDLKTKSSRAVSLVLLSCAGNSTINGRPCKSFSSPASGPDQDSMLKKIEPSESTNESLMSHLNTSVTEIVDTIVKNMDALSTYSMSCHSLESDHSLTSGICDTETVEFAQSLMPCSTLFIRRSRIFSACLKL
ncbi:hypothetical protein SRHO_G00058410 [Serrasalmus rhombeus]